MAHWASPHELYLPPQGGLCHCGPERSRGPHRHPTVFPHLLTKLSRLGLLFLKKGCSKDKVPSTLWLLLGPHSMLPHDPSRLVSTGQPDASGLQSISAMGEAGGPPCRTLINRGAPWMDKDLKGLRTGFSLLPIVKWGVRYCTPRATGGILFALQSK